MAKLEAWRVYIIPLFSYCAQFYEPDESTVREIDATLDEILGVDWFSRTRRFIDEIERAGVRVLPHDTVGTLLSFKIGRILRNSPDIKEHHREGRVVYQNLRAARGTILVEYGGTTITKELRVFLEGEGHILPRRAARAICMAQDIRQRNERTQTSLFIRSAEVAWPRMKDNIVWKAQCLKRTPLPQTTKATMVRIRYGGVAISSRPWQIKKKGVTCVDLPCAINGCPHDTITQIGVTEILPVCQIHFDLLSMETGGHLWTIDPTVDPDLATLNSTLCATGSSDPPQIAVINAPRRQAINLVFKDGKRKKLLIPVPK